VGCRWAWGLALSPVRFAFGCWLLACLDTTRLGLARCASVAFLGLAFAFGARAGLAGLSPGFGMGGFVGLFVRRGYDAACPLFRGFWWLSAAALVAAALGLPREANCWPKWDRRAARWGGQYVVALFDFHAVALGWRNIAGCPVTMKIWRACWPMPLHLFNCFTLTSFPNPRLCLLLGLHPVLKPPPSPPPSLSPSPSPRRRRSLMRRRAGGCL
jgi:hypothetical protein